MNTIMTAMQCDAIIHEFSEKATRVKEINSFLCLLKNGIFHLSVFDPEANECVLVCARNDTQIAWNLEQSGSEFPPEIK